MSFSKKSMYIKFGIILTVITVVLIASKLHWCYLCGSLALKQFAPGYWTCNTHYEELETSLTHSRQQNTGNTEKRICLHVGCNEPVAVSKGHTNYCKAHSNHCLVCRTLINEGETRCWSCEEAYQAKKRRFGW